MLQTPCVKTLSTPFAFDLAYSSYLRAQEAEVGTGIYRASYHHTPVTPLWLVAGRATMPASVKEARLKFG
jgi:hypothetical protein